jgi:hypothetical protein
LGIAVAAAATIFLLDWLIRPRKGILRSGRFLHDVLYSLFYNSILAAAVLAIPAARLLLPVLRSLNWHTLATLPALRGLVIFFVAADLGLTGTTAGCIPDFYGHSIRCTTSNGN